MLTTKQRLGAAAIALAVLPLFIAGFLGRREESSRWNGGKAAALSPTHPLPEEEPGPSAPLASRRGEKPERQRIDPGSLDKATSGSSTAPRYSISGRILTAELEPAEGMEVSVDLMLDARTKEARERLKEEYGLESSSPTQRTDQEGHFHFEGLPSASYTMRVQDPVEEDLPSDEQLEADAVWSFTLKPRLSIRGQVLGLQEQQGRVYVTRIDTLLEDAFGLGDFHDFGEGSPQTLTEPDGSYVVKGLQPGLHQVLASADGCGYARRRFLLTRSQEGVDLELMRGLKFAGQFKADFPINERFNQVYLSPNPLAHDLFSSAIEPDGSFSFANLAPGRYEISVGLRPRGEKKSVQRTFAVDLQEDLTDFRRTITRETQRIRIRAQGPEGEHYVDGVLTATGRHGFHSSVVRLSSGGGARSHGIWKLHEKLFNPTASFHCARTFPLELSPGEWQIRLAFSGYEEWSQRVLVSRTQEIEAQLEPRAGRVVLAKANAKDVCVEARLLPDGEWFKVLEHDYNYRPVLEIVPYTSWLAEGRYDLRVSTRSTAEHLIENVEVKASHQPLEVASPEEEGLRISGRLLSNARSYIDLPLYLFIQDGGQWRPLPRKTAECRSAYPLTGMAFDFLGLHPGRYQACVDEAGHQVAAHWELTTADLLSEVIEYEFR